MKRLNLALLLVVALSAPQWSEAAGTQAGTASRAAVYCKIRTGAKAKIHNASSEDGHFACAAHLREGKACFSGYRSDVIRMINARQFDWDEEWLEGAHYRGTNGVAYRFKDGPNDLSFKLSMDPCPNGFFNRPEVGPSLNQGR